MVACAIPVLISVDAVATTTMPLLELLHKPQNKLPYPWNLRYRPTTPFHTHLR